MNNILLRNIIYNDLSSDILIEDGVIKKISPTGSLRPVIHYDINNTEVFNCNGKHAFPGFINMHTHSAMTLMRGMEEDVTFQEWIQNIWQIETDLDSDFVYWGAMVAALEMIKTGTTTFNDQYWFSSMSKDAALDMGIRPIISYVILDKGDSVKAESQKEQYSRLPSMLFIP